MECDKMERSQRKSGQWEWRGNDSEHRKAGPTCKSHTGNQRGRLGEETEKKILLIKGHKWWWNQGEI
jgi:hypothetical protein